jgi:DNA-binding transcriptional regulator YiaG
MRGQQIREIRERLGLSRRKFAERYHLAAGTLHGWEIERYTIPLSAQVLLTLIDREPETIAAILARAG